MQSKTSFFNKTVLKKDITRYSPIWAVYTIFLLLMIISMANLIPAITAENLLEFLTAMGPLNFVYAGICAAFLFMDLFNGRLCNALHAFPLRREGWLCTHILSGFLFSFVPNVAAMLLAAPMLWKYAYIAPIWLAGSTLQFTFFFGSAVLCAVCAGNLIGMGTLYGIFHFITTLIYGAVQLLYQPLLHGIQMEEDAFFRFFPLNRLVNDFEYVYYTTDNRSETPVGQFEGFAGQDWLYLGLCAIVGLLCLLLAWQTYKKRNLEHAGDLLSCKKLSPLYLVICTMGVGMFLFLFFALLTPVSYFFLVVGMFIGFFAGRMLLYRTVKVFNKKAFARLGIFTAVLIGTFVLTAIDPIGITRYVPATDKIQCAAVVGADKSRYYPRDYYENETMGGYLITDAEEIAKMQDLHRELITYRPEYYNSRLCDVRIVYQLENGRVVQRHYEVDPNSTLGQRAKAYSSDMRYIFEVNDLGILDTAFESVTIDGGKVEAINRIKLTDPAEIQGLLDAIQKDCEAGNMAQNYAYHDGYEELYYLDFSIEDHDLQYTWGTSRKHLQVWTNSTNTVAYLRQMIAAHSEE